MVGAPRSSARGGAATFSDPTDVLSLPLPDGQYLAYRVVGKHHSAAPVVLIHGLPDASDSWIPIVAALGASRPVYAVDLAGYGYSERPMGADVSLAAQARYLIEFLDRLHLGRVVLVGHDIGGGVAQLVAAANPQRVERMVLINSVVDDHWPVLEPRLLCVPFLGPMSLALADRLLWRHVLRKGLFDRARVTRALIQRYRRWYSGRPGRRRLVRNARALRNSDLTARSDAIRAMPVRTLFLWGREDRFLDSAPAMRLCREMRHCRFGFIERAGHYLLDEQSPRVSEIVGAWLRE